MGGGAGGSRKGKVLRYLDALNGLLFDMNFKCYKVLIFGIGGYNAVLNLGGGSLNN